MKAPVTPTHPQQRISGGRTTGIVRGFRSSIVIESDHRKAHVNVVADHLPQRLLADDAVARQRLHGQQIVGQRRENTPTGVVDSGSTCRASPSPASPTSPICRRKLFLKEISVEHAGKLADDLSISITPGLSRVLHERFFIRSIATENRSVPNNTVYTASKEWASRRNDPHKCDGCARPL